MNFKRLAIFVGVLLFVLLAILASIFLRAPYSGEQAAEVFVDGDDTKDSVLNKLSEKGISVTAFKLLSIVKEYRPSTGRYVITNDLSATDLFRKLRNRQQDPVNVTIPSSRTFDRVASAIAHNLMMDSASIHETLTDKAIIERLGYTTETFPALFIPNTYEVYWDISIDDLLSRLKKENERFWTDERQTLANELGMTREEVYTLASIVDEETANDGEKPMIAGLYLNRLHKGMLLQADPTVKKAVGDWSLRRVLNVHLHTDSPYNTYRYQGLPPGPLRITSIAGIDAVLHHSQHNYLYMCAKEDFSGTHNFAATYAEHQQNARRYVNALNQRGIK